MKRIVVVISTVLFVFIYMNACDSSPTSFTPDNDPNVNQQPFGEATLGDSTRIIPSETSQRITEISAEGTVFTFDGDDVVLTNLEEGDVMIFDQSEQTPLGALRKISNIQRTETNGVVQYTVTTEDATFEDAFENLEINTSKLQLNPSDVDSIVYFVESTGMRNLIDLDEHLKNVIGNEFSHSFNIYLDGSASDPQNSIRFSGNINFLSELLLSLDLKSGDIREIIFTNENTISLDAELYAGLQETIEKEQILFTYYFTPFAVGPVIIAPILDLEVNVEGTASANFRPNVEYQIEAYTELKYASGSWINDHSFTHDMTGEMPLPQFNASVKGAIGPRLNLLVYGVLGPKATLTAYTEGLYNPQNIPQVEVYAGVTGDIELQMRIISWVLTSYRHNFLNYRNLIYSFGFTTRSVSNITDTTAQSGGVFESEGNQNVTQKGVCWSTSPMPDTNDSCTNDGSGTEDYTSTISSLQPNTQYYVRAYAQAGGDVVYGDQINFLTQSSQNNGQISGIILDAISEAPIQGVNIIVQESTGSILAQSESQVDGNYNLDVTSGNGYKVTFTKNGYLPAEYSDVSVESNQTTYLSQVLYIDENFSGPGIISGRIIDAVSGNGVSDLNLTLIEGFNNSTGTELTQVTTGNNGNYQFTGIDAGYYTTRVTGVGYNSTQFNVISIGGQNTDGQNATVTPELNDDEYRIVLTWGENPSDLDSHLTGPNPSGGRFHIYYIDKTFTYNGEVFALLDRDDVTSYGPETITINNQTAGTYRYSVHDYTNRGSTNSSALSLSNAQVRLYKGNQLLSTFNVPNNQPGTLWTVFELNGSNIVTINSMSFESNPGSVQSTTNINDANIIKSALDSYSKD